MSKIKITNGYIDMLTQGALKPLLNNEIPAILAYHIALVVERIQVDAKALAATKQNIIQKYALTDDEGNRISAGDNKIAFKEGGELAAIKEFAEIMSIEIELDIDRLKIDLANLPNTSVSIMSILMPLIEKI